MLTRGIFFKLETPKNTTIYVLEDFNEVLEETVCYLIKKTLCNNALENLDVRYRYDRQKVNNAHTSIEHMVYVAGSLNLLNNIQDVLCLLERNLDDLVNEFNIYCLSNRDSVLNVNSVLINTDTLIVCSELLRKS